MQAVPAGVLFMDRLTILKVKGIDPDRISAIHAEIARLNAGVETLEGFLLAHPTAKALEAKLEAECVAQYKDWKHHQLEYLMSEDRKKNDELMYRDPGQRAELAQSRAARAHVIADFKSTAQVSLEKSGDWPHRSQTNQESRVASILKCALGDEYVNYYGIEVRIRASFKFKVRASYTFPAERDRQRGVQNIISECEDFELIPGDYLYGKLFELLGIKPVDGEPDVSKMLLSPKQ